MKLAHRWIRFRLSPRSLVARPSPSPLPAPFPVMEQAASLAANLAPMFEGPDGPQHTDAAGNLPEVPIDHLDYTFVRDCSAAQWRDLERVILVLRSGREGWYPDLLRAAENRLADIRPASRLLRQQQGPVPVNDRTAVAAALDAWSSSIDSVDGRLRAAARSDPLAAAADVDPSAADAAPPIRQPARVVSAAKPPAPALAPTTAAASVAAEADTAAAGSSQAKQVPRSARDWDKFDVDAELRRIDDQQAEAERHDHALRSAAPIPGAAHSPKEQRELADAERRKGNDAFQAGDFDKALRHYQNSLAIADSTEALNNRGLTYLRLGRPAAALADCQAVLEREPANLKARIRRASALRGVGRIADARAAITTILAESPSNVSALKELADITAAEQAAAAARPQQGPTSANADTASGAGRRRRRMVIEEVDDAVAEKPPAAHATNDDLVDDSVVWRSAESVSQRPASPESPSPALQPSSVQEIPPAPSSASDLVSALGLLRGDHVALGAYVTQVFPAALKPLLASAGISADTLADVVGGVASALLPAHPAEACDYLQVLATTPGFEAHVRVMSRQGARIIRKALDALTDPSLHSRISTLKTLYMVN
jgi:tetratricopeptide (TPR) repeat protein